MFRVLLTAYVTLVMLAGPSACCCTTAHVFAGCFAGETSESGEDRPACCCGRHAQADGGGSKEAAADGGQECPGAPGDEHECPCRANKTHAVAEAKKQVAELQQFRSLVPAPLDLPVAGAAVTDATPSCPGSQIRNRASHFGSAREILRALQTYLI